MTLKPNRDITAVLEDYDRQSVLHDIGNTDIIINWSKRFIAQALTKQKEEIVKYVRDEVIGENEWEDPDIEGSDQSNGDMVVKPWRRNGLRAEQRRKLNELK